MLMGDRVLKFLVWTFTPNILIPYNLAISTELKM